MESTALRVLGKLVEPMVTSDWHCVDIDNDDNTPSTALKVLGKLVEPMVTSDWHCVDIDNDDDM
jgi:hypothetical protein